MNTQTESNIIQQIRSNSWRQGSILNNKTADNANNLEIGLYLLLSQDCDICHGSIADEPQIEIINCHPVNGTPDGNITYGKNPRRLQFKLSDNGYYELHAKDRQFVKREILANTCPDNDLHTPEKSLRLVINWIKKRHDRDAFPFEFDERFSRKNRDKLKKLLQNDGENIIGLFIRINTMEELSSDKPYTLDLVLLIEEGDNNRKILQNTLEKIHDLLDTNTGINVLPGYRMLTPEEISLAEFMTLSELDYDYISFRDDNEK